MFNTVKKINHANKHSTIKGMNISAGNITSPKSCLKMAPSMSGKYWVNMIDFANTLLNLIFVSVGMYYVNNSTRDREEIV